MMTDQVEITDQEDNLRVLNYKECSNDSPMELKKVRGMVEEIDTGRILFKTFPYTEGYSPSETSLVIGNIEDWEVYHSIEGTMVRVFWYNGRWYISTHKKLNAFKSRWSSRKSFGEMFRDFWVGVSGGDENVLEKLLDDLDQSYVYFFLIRFNHENRMVCQVEKDAKEHVLFIGRWKDEEVGLEREWPYMEKWRISSPKKLDLQVEEIPEYVQNIDINRYQGLILFHRQEHRHIKIISPEYERLYRVRGNNPNIRFRYLEVRQDLELRKEIINLYPPYQDIFLEYENILFQIAKLVRYYYIQRYIKNKYVTLPKEEYVLMKKCHDWYLSNRNENKINISKVLELLNQEDTLSLYRMIRRHQMNQINQQRGVMQQNVQEFPCSWVAPTLANIDLEFISP
jgi:hypothetical protein